ncbi:hypothetical protein AA13594_2937 [Gluconacetobacter azotocaptans DSM 13594]|nr:hypothetical protein AA13594_2937 [Gluconacetobacter azotocaptans DSM 13594]
MGKDCCMNGPGASGRVIDCVCRGQSMKGAHPATAGTEVPNLIGVTKLAGILENWRTRKDSNL